MCPRVKFSRVTRLGAHPVRLSTQGERQDPKLNQESENGTNTCNAKQYHRFHLDLFAPLPVLLSTSRRDSHQDYGVQGKLGCHHCRGALFMSALRRDGTLKNVNFLPCAMQIDDQSVESVHAYMLALSTFGPVLHIVLPCVLQKGG